MSKPIKGTTENIRAIALDIVNLLKEHKVLKLREHLLLQGSDDLMTSNTFKYTKHSRDYHISLYTIEEDFTLIFRDYPVKAHITTTHYVGPQDPVNLKKIARVLTELLNHFKQSFKSNNMNTALNDVTLGGTFARMIQPLEQLVLADIKLTRGLIPIPEILEVYSYRSMMDNLSKEVDPASFVYESCNNPKEIIMGYPTMMIASVFEVDQILNRPHETIDREFFEAHKDEIVQTFNTELMKVLEGPLQLVTKSLIREPYNTKLVIRHIGMYRITTDQVLNFIYLIPAEQLPVELELLYMSTHLQKANQFIDYTETLQTSPKKKPNPRTQRP